VIGSDASRFKIESSTTTDDPHAKELFTVLLIEIVLQHAALSCVEVFLKQPTLPAALKTRIEQARSAGRVRDAHAVCLGSSFIGSDSTRSVASNCSIYDAGRAAANTDFHSAVELSTSSRGDRIDSRGSSAVCKRR